MQGFLDQAEWAVPVLRAFVFAIQRIKNGVDVGAASMGGVRISFQDEEAAASRCEAVVEGAVGKEEVAHRDGVGFGVVGSTFPTTSGAVRVTW